MVALLTTSLYGVEKERKKNTCVVFFTAISSFGYARLRSQAEISENILVLARSLPSGRWPEFERTSTMPEPLSHHGNSCNFIFWNCLCEYRDGQASDAR